jgi:flagellin-like protein
MRRTVMKAIAKRSRGISPLIATIILIAITVVGGLLVYSIFTSTSNTMSAKALVSVEAADLVMSSDGQQVQFSIVIKNTGNKPIKELKVKLASEDEATVTLPVGGLQPGQSVAYSAEPSGTYVVGNTYTVVIKATFSDGSTFVTTAGVMCRFA